MREVRISPIDETFDNDVNREVWTFLGHFQEKVVVIVEGVVHINFIGSLRWVSLYLLKKVQMRSNHTLVGVSRGFSISEL